jgi:hypothetical protein
MLIFAAYLAFFIYKNSIFILYHIKWHLFTVVFQPDNQQYAFLYIPFKYTIYDSTSKSARDALTDEERAQALR